MSYSEFPAETDVERLLASQAETQRLITGLTEAVNGMGANVQWIIDNVQGIFQMFGSPQMMAMLPAMMNGAMSAVPNEEANAG